MKNTIFSSLGKIAATALHISIGVFIALPLHADDTEIYFTQSGNAGDPNILFILDASRSMLYRPEDIPFVSPQFPPTQVQPGSRYAIMKNALIASINNIQKANIGLLNYGGHKEPAQANGIKLPISPLSAELIGEITNQIDDFEVDGFTPISQTLYEAALYFRGQKVDYGNSVEPQRRADLRTFVQNGGSDIITTSGGYSIPGAEKSECESLSDEVALEQELKEKYTGYVDGSLTNLDCVNSTSGSCSAYLESGECASGAFTTDGTVIGVFRSYDFKVEKTTGTYISPIKNECQENVIVLLSDGLPDDGLGSAGNAPNDQDVINKIQAMTNSSSCKALDEGLKDGSCGAELTQFLASVDQSDIHAENQLIKTYVVGFAIDGKAKNYLESIAVPHEGNQGFYTADNEDALTQALTSITADLVNVNSSFSPPSITIESGASQSNSAEIFVPMFRASQLPRWNGNIKGYRLNTTVSPSVLIDSKDNPVLDDDKKIVETAQSAWLPVTDDADGAEVAAGGAARLLGTQRNLFTHDDADKLLALTEENLKDVSWFDLQPKPQLKLGNKVTSKLGQEEQLELIKFIRGIDPVTGTESRQAMGDVLHSRPVIVDYVKAIGDQPNEESLTGKVIFVGTNEGYLHAIRASDGKELFAFMPQQLLRNVKTLYDNVAADGSVAHPYGMDGQIAIWRNDADGDGAIDAKMSGGVDRNLDGKNNYLDKDFVWIFAGMRRGGKNYYALDVTKPEAPVLKWVLRGGEDDFKKLGQTWATPILTRVDPVMIDGINHDNPLDVLVISGGYDTHQDQQGTETGQDDNEGNAIFMVEPDTGERLWWASRSGANLSLEAMANSIPASVRVLDVDSNGVADRLYAADTGGRIFRIDLPDTHSQKIHQGKFDKTGAGISPVASLFADIAITNGTENTRRFYYEPDIALVNDRNKPYLTVAIGSGYRAHPLEQKTQDRLYVFKDYDVTDLPDKDEPFLGTNDLIEARTITNSEDVIELTTGSDINNNARNGWYVDLERKKGEKALARAVTFDNKVFFTTFLPETTQAEDVCSSSSHTGRVYALDVRTGRPAINFLDKDSEPTLFTDGILNLNTTDILSEVYFNLSRTEGGAPVVDAFIGASFNERLFQKTENRIEKIYWQEQINH